ncbi:TolC family outer membrane protein [Candidatus Pelagibacter sp.]|nr:TolC family outer membrane protein [Candidatus Pelagibacter sp.]
MKKFLIIILSNLFIISNLSAETFTEALKKAYKNNSELNAERENISISEQELKISMSSYLPTITLEGSKSQNETDKLTNRDGSNATITDVDTETKSISVTQTLFDFGRGADLSKSKIGINLAKAKLLKKEQDILYKTVAAYTGLISAKEKLEINRANVELLSRQVETDRIRLERGQISLSDVSQSESSLAGAEASFIQAQSDLLTSKLNYENIIGSLDNAQSLDKSSIISYQIPGSLNSAIEQSKKSNPDLIIAEMEYEQSKKDTSIARSELVPTAKLSLEKSYSDDLSATYDERDKETLKATVTWPFYSGGKNLASLNKNKNIENRSRLTLDSEIKQNQTNVASAWSNFQSNKSLLNSVQLQVRAAEIANEGITAEYNSGSSGRTTLEVIQSNSLLLNAQISLADSERNFILSQFNLLKSIGLLNSDYLKLH